MREIEVRHLPQDAHPVKRNQAKNALVELVRRIVRHLAASGDLSPCSGAREQSRASENGFYFRTTAVAIAPRTGNHHRAVKVFWQTFSVLSAVNVLVGVERSSRSQGQGSDG